MQWFIDEILSKAGFFSQMLLIGSWFYVIILLIVSLISFIIYIAKKIHHDN